MSRLFYFMPIKKSHTLGSDKRLKSKLKLNELFSTGTAIKVFPLRALVSSEEGPEGGSVQVAFSAPKRKYSKAVDRNRIKRLMRESYRVYGHGFQQLAIELKCNTSILFVYISHKIVDQEKMDESMTLVLEQISNLLKSSK